MEPIAYFQVVKTNKTVLKDGSAVTVTKVGYQYRHIPNAPTYWPGKRSLKDLGDHANESRNGPKKSSEEDTRKAMFIKMLYSDEIIDKIFLSFEFLSCDSLFNRFYSTKKGQTV